MFTGFLVLWLPTCLCLSDLLLLVARRVRGREVHDLVTGTSLCSSQYLGFWLSVILIAPGDHSATSTLRATPHLDPLQRDSQPLHPVKVLWMQGPTTPQDTVDGFRESLVREEVCEGRDGTSM